MNEQQNVALVQKALEAFGRGDVQAILDLSSNDSEFRCPGPEIIPYAGTKRGHSEIQTYFDALITTQKNANLSIDRFVAQGDTVVAIGRYTAQVNSTGKSIDTPVMLAFELQDGKIKRHLVMGDTAAIADSYTAAAAAGR
ncbi:MAG: nuclear transport factor 2 family protein [Acidobacteriota bacterium]|nr:nuclear transport factor 2 family protein [Acidobacteriota bacterium]